MVLHMIIKQLQKHIVSRVGIFPRNYVGIKYMYFQHGQIQGTAETHETHETSMRLLINLISSKFRGRSYIHSK